MSKCIRPIVSIFLAFTLLCGGTVNAAEYTDPELNRAVLLGFGEYLADNPALSFAEYVKMLDKLVETVDAGKLPVWQTRILNALNSRAQMTRSDGMFALFCAAEVLGEDYAGQNADYGALWENMGNWDGKAGQNYSPNAEIFGEDFINGMPEARFDPLDINGSRWSDAWYFSFGRASLLTQKSLFDYDAASNTMRAEQPFLYNEALLSVVRLHDSGLTVSERWATADDKAILDEFEARKQEIMTDMTEVAVTGAKYYVSNNGNDANNGLSPQTAWATIEKALTVKKYGDAVLFERGGIFRGTLSTQMGVTYLAYGIGSKPIITHSPENGAGAEKWKLVEGTANIWRFYRDMRQCGSIVVGGDTVILRVCPFWDGEKYLQVLNYEVVENNMKIGAAFDFKTMLPNNTFFNDIRHPQGSDLADPPFETEGALYFRCDEGNPGAIYNNIEFSMIAATSNPVCTLDKDVLVDNLAFLYASNGVNCENGPSVTNATIQNCEVGFTGGRVTGYSDVYFTGNASSRRVGRDGDGIMLMGNNVKAINNYVHDVWDHAFTIETMYGTWSDEEKRKAAEPNFKFYYDITIEDNVAEDCASLFLLIDWTLVDTLYERPAALNEYRDFTIKNNYSINNGYHWRSQSNDSYRTDRGGIGFGHPVGSGGFNVSGNVIYRTNVDTEYSDVALFYYPEAEKPVFSGNTFVQDNYAPLVWQKPLTIIQNDWPSADAVQQSVRDLLGDAGTVVLPLSLPPSLARPGETRKLGDTFPIPVKGLNSITTVTYKLISGDAVLVTPEGIVTALQAGTAEIQAVFSNGINEDVTQMYTITVE